MPNQPTAKIDWRLISYVNRMDDSSLAEVERYALSELPELPWPWNEDRNDLRQYSKDDIRAVIESERVFRATTLDEWLEIARDFYQDATGTNRRPKLLEDEFVTFLRLNAKYGADENWFRPEHFLNAVWVLGRDAAIDHATFESLPYYLEHGVSWQAYLSKSYKQFRKYMPPDDTAGILGFGGEPEQSVESEPEATVAHPNCKARCHMGKFEFAVYDFAMGVSRKEGTCWLSRNTVGKWTGGMHPQTARRCINWLVEHGWLVELKKPRAGVGGQGEYRVVEHDSWIENHSDASCLRAPLTFFKGSPHDPFVKG
jgi:hypothetical protein